MKHSGPLSTRSVARKSESYQSEKPDSKRPKAIDAEEFDRLFESGADVSQYLGESQFFYSKEERAEMRKKSHVRVEVDLLPETLRKLEARARKIDCTPNEVIESIVEDRINPQNPD